MLTTKTLSGRAPNSIGEETILYLRNAPARASNNKKNEFYSFHFSVAPTIIPFLLLYLGRHYQHHIYYKCGFGIRLVCSLLVEPMPMLMP